QIVSYEIDPYFGARRPLVKQDRFKRVDRRATCRDRLAVVGKRHLSIAESVDRSRYSTYPAQNNAGACSGADGQPAKGQLLRRPQSRVIVETPDGVDVSMMIDQASNDRPGGFLNVPDIFAMSENLQTASRGCRDEIRCPCGQSRNGWPADDEHPAVRHTLRYVCGRVGRACI